MIKNYILMAVALLSVWSAGAQKTFDYNDLSNGLWAQRSVELGASMNDGEHYTVRSGDKIEKYSYKTGEKVATLFDAATVTPKINFSNYTFSADETKLLFTTNIKRIYRHSFSAEYYICDLVSGTMAPLSGGGAQQVATLSPDGKRAAFVRGNNLFWIDLATMTEHQITFDGKTNEVLNGIPDWVYEEEYTFSRAYEWSPSSDKIAFYRTDESRVKRYNMNTFNNELYPDVYQFKYPKAGEQNSIVSILSFDFESGKSTKMKIGDEDNQYVPRILWSKSGELGVARLNRAQNNFDLLFCDPSTGESHTVYNETNPRYVERIDNQTITFLDDPDKFIVRSEKEGFMHLYLYSVSKGMLNRITEGAWDVSAILGVDEKKSTVYYMSSEESPLRRNLYTVKLNGKEKKKLTPESGTYSIAPSRGFKYYISFFSNATTPNNVSLHSHDGKLMRVLEDNAAMKAQMKEYQLPQKEFFTFKTSEGVELNGYFVKPNGFDSTKVYPLFMTQYSGPGSQSVLDHFNVSWEDVLVQEGYMVACVDGRGTGSRGEEFKKCTYKDLGKYEVIDQIEAAKYLGSLSYIDASRIAIYGWSYGGFMSLNCILKGNDLFKVAISVAPVTSWRYYDTIYTELYNGLPQENPDGYDKNSPLFFADRLKGKLLIAHGTGDDNVHIQNTYEMISALSREGKPFEMCIYPDQNHGMGSGRNHLMRKCIDFIKTNL